MKILFIAKYSPKSGKKWGGEMHIINLATKLAENGIAVYFINSDYTGIYDKVKYIQVPYKKFRKTPFSAKIKYVKKIINVYNIDLVHVFFTNGFLIKKLKKQFDIPIIYTENVWRLDPNYKIKYPFVFLFYGKPFIYFAFKSKLSAMKNADMVVTNSRALSFLVKYYSKQKNVKIVNNGVDKNLFKSQKYPKKNIKTAITLSRLDKSKGIQDIIKAINILNFEGYDNIKFLIFGSGPYMRKLYLLVLKHDLTDKIKFYGKIEHEKVPKIFKRANFYISASWFEGFSNTILESMACARPFITTRIGGSADQVIDNYNGLSVKIKSPNELAEKIKFLIENSKKAEKMGLNGRKMVEEKFSWVREAKEYLKIYNKIIQDCL